MNQHLNSTAGNLVNVVPSRTLTNLHRIDRNEWSVTCNTTLQNVRNGVDDICMPTFSCLLDGACRIPEHGNAPPGDCGPNTATWTASVSGLGFNGLSTEQKAGLYADSCSTLEDHAVGAARLDLSVSRVSASDQYWNVVPMPSGQAETARHDLIKQAKLMFELGISSPNVSSDTLRELYTTAPTDELSCGVSAQPPVSSGCVSWGASHGFDGSLGLCQRLLSSHVAPSLVVAELDRCQGLLASPALAGTEACAVEYRNAVETLEERLIIKGFSAIQRQASSSTLVGLGAALAQIDRWYTGAAAALAADPGALSDATGRVLTGFWTRVYAVGASPPSFALGDAGSEAARTQLGELFAARLDTERQVLAAAFADPAPLDEVPLLLLTSDSMATLNARLRSAAPLYDFACRVRGGCGVANANEATKLIRLVGAIGDGAALDEALTAGANGAVRSDWLDVFSALRSRRSVLEAAYRKATGRSAASLGELYSGSVVASAAGLADVASRSSMMWASYKSHGSLLPSAANVIRTSLVDTKVAATLQSFITDWQDLRQQRLDYQKTRGDFARTILDRIANQQFLDRVGAEATQLHTEFDNVTHDLGGLMASQDQAEQVIGKFLATYAERAQDPQWLRDYPVNGTPAHLAIDATQAHGSGTMASDVTVVAVRDPHQPAQPWKLDVAAGDMLTFEVTGTWSPTCALRDMTLVAPSGTTSFADPSRIQIGPEGFSISFSSTTFQAREHQSSDFSTETDSTSICGSISAALPSVGGVVGIPLQVGQLSVTGSMCKQWQTGHTDTDSTSNGSRSQYNADFAGGLRIPGTPFPTLPGGSLLLVEVIHETDGDHIREAHVIRPHSTVVFPKDAKVYLVANDRGGCAAVDTSALSVTYLHGHSIAPAAASLAQVMATVLSTIEARKATSVGEGSVTPAELNELQLGAYDELNRSCHCTLGNFPAEVRGMFDAWLAAELASIERQVRITTAERSLDSLALRLKALQSDLAGAADASRLLTLMTYWELSDPAFQGALSATGTSTHPELRAHAELVLEQGNEEMLPILRLLYPQALDAIRTRSSDLIEALRTFDWTLPYDEQVQRLEGLADIMGKRLLDALQSGGLATAPVIVAFPKPSAVGATVLPRADGAVVAAPSRLPDVWERCAADATRYCLRRRPKFTISPEDVYGQPLVGLGCHEVAPVVHTFAVFAGNNGDNGNEDWNANPHRADIFRSAEGAFPTETELLDYRMEGPLAPSRVRVLAGEPQNVWHTFDLFERPASNLQGVTPFGSFAVELGDYATDRGFPIAGSDIIYVVLELQTRTSTSLLASVGVCAQPLGMDESPPAFGSDSTLTTPAGAQAAQIRGAR
jgi:hypothetical protein